MLSIYYVTALLPILRSVQYDRSIADPGSTFKIRGHFTVNPDFQVSTVTLQQLHY